MGMWIAIHVALRRPDRVAGLVGIGAAPDFFQRFWLTLSMEDRDSFEKDKLLLRQSPYR
jgi:pimeloyl-ACP methyl ester carboxylesterase